MAGITYRGTWSTRVIISEDEARVMAGKRTDEVVRHWRQTKKLEHVPNEHLEAVIGDAVIKSIRQHGKELPGVHHVINLFEQHNIPMAVASSSSPEIIEAVLNKLDLAKYMKITYSAKHEKFGKPHPGVFLTTAKKLSVSPENCIVFEDALYGIRAAKAAGMKCVGVPEFANAKKPEFQEADILVPSLEVITWAMLVRLFES